MPNTDYEIETWGDIESRERRDKERKAHSDILERNRRYDESPEGRARNAACEDAQRRREINNATEEAVKKALDQFKAEEYRKTPEYKLKQAEREAKAKSDLQFKLYQEKIKRELDTQNKESAVKQLTYIQEKERLVNKSKSQRLTYQEEQEYFFDEVVFTEEAWLLMKRKESDIKVPLPSNTTLELYVSPYKSKKGYYNIGDKGIKLVSQDQYGSISNFYVWRPYKRSYKGKNGVLSFFYRVWTNPRV